MKILIIGNPISGKGAAKKKIELLTSRLKHLDHEVNIYFTKFAGDGKEYVSGIEQQHFDRLVIAGGDGTINEILNGIPEDFKIPTMIVSTGNANLLARELRTPQCIETMADIIIKGKIILADYALLNNTKFLMVAGAGFDALVCEELKKIRKGVISNLSYLLPIFRVLRSFNNKEFSVTVDGKYIGTSPAVIVSNVRNYAGIFDLACNAGITTGYLDIIMLPKINFFRLIKYALILKFLNIKKIKGAKYINGSEIIINSNEPVPVELDGDFKDRFSEVYIKIIPEKLPLIVK